SPGLHRLLDHPRRVHVGVGGEPVPRIERCDLSRDCGGVRPGRRGPGGLSREVPAQGEATLMACPVCFGDASAPMTVAANNGIWFMLAIVAAMLSAFASFFIYLIRRAKRVADSSEPTADAGRYVRGQ